MHGLHADPSTAVDRPRHFTVRDVLVTARLAILAALAWSLPPRWWAAVCRPWARLSVRLHSARTARQRERLRALFGPMTVNDADRLSASIVEAHHLSQLQLLRCHRIGGWRPHIDFVGRDHVTRALEAGKGAILWVSPTSYAMLVTKMALAREGFEVSHLSREQHGFSASRLGMRLLNPILTSVEERYLKERLVMSAEDSARALVALVQRLRSNQLVSMTVGPLGHRTHAVPLENGALWMAEGAPVLAFRTGAALLPVFTVRTADDSFATVVEPPLSTAPNLDRAAAVQASLAGYVAVLERYLARWPEQFAVLESITLIRPGRRDPSPAAPRPNAGDPRGAALP